VANSYVSHLVLAKPPNLIGFNFAFVDCAYRLAHEELARACLARGNLPVAVGVRAILDFVPSKELLSCILKFATMLLPRTQSASATANNIVSSGILADANYHGDTNYSGSTSIAVATPNSRWQVRRPSPSPRP
jgi:hypothetical protein